ncbi:hypothetical protein [Mycoplasma sp. 1654_15]|uniref:hypothetical protein n=1 Tax=Mycoplasma sp. 1654_15 TaxID=2725994 RepID=UPI0015975C97|nr:hypothetical protein [Mycoplasma sp. 1654_15]QKG28210.1 hypothetical protein HF996_03459 [Mycoplasma sp. 1654_15]
MSNYDPKFLSENSILIWWNSLTSSNNSYQPFIWNEGFLSCSSFALFGSILSQYGIISMSFLLLVLGLIYFGYRTISIVKKSKKLSNLTINKGVKL